MTIVAGLRPGVDGPDEWSYQFLLARLNETDDLALYLAGISGDRNHDRASIVKWSYQ
jgi:hypothetical protein